MYLNNTSASQAESCLRKHYWMRETHALGGLGLQSPWIDDNLVFGQVVHIGLASLYQGASVSQAQKEAKDYFYNDAVPFDAMAWDDKNKWLEHLEWIDRILSEYNKYRKDVDEFTVVEIENEGCVTLGEICYKCGEPYPSMSGTEFETFFECPKCAAEVHHWVFRTDLVVDKDIQKGTAKYVIDHKTTKSASDNYLASWHNSFQLWGYCYGYAKYTGNSVRGYGINIIRKLKSIGLERKDTKQCPTCRNGKHKRVGCETCKSAGTVARDATTSDQPFTREWASFNEEHAERFVRQRLNTIERIVNERERFKTEPDVAWPMNPNECYNMGKCPFIKLCYGGDPERWWEPPTSLLDTYEARDADYVNVRQMAREEMR